MAITRRTTSPTCSSPTARAWPARRASIRRSRTWRSPRAPATTPWRSRNAATCEAFGVNMIKQRWWLLALGACASALGAQTRPTTFGATEARPNQLTAAERVAGWRLLFDGRTLAGWRGLGYDTVPTAHW